MTDAKDTRTIHERMVAVLAELPAIGKNQKNQQQGFMFRGHDDVLNALNPLLAKHGVFVVPLAMGRETSQRSTKSGSVMFEVSLLVEFTFYGAGGDSVTARAWGEGTDSGDKATSKAHTMAFKTALNQAFSVSSAETVDPDAHTADATDSTKAANGTAVISSAQRKRLWAIAQENAVSEELLREIVLDIAGVESTQEIPRAKYDALIEALQAQAVPFT